MSLFIFSAYKNFNRHSESKTLNKLDSFEMSIHHRKINGNNFYFQCRSEILYKGFDRRSVLGMGALIVNVNTTFPLTEEWSDCFKAFWKTETHNNEMQTIPGCSSYSCSRSPVLEQTNDFNSCNDFKSSCRQDWLSTSSESLTALHQSVLMYLQSRFVTSRPSSLAFSEKQVETLRTCIYRKKNLHAYNAYLWHDDTCTLFHSAKRKYKNSQVSVLIHHCGRVFLRWENSNVSLISALQ